MEARIVAKDRQGCCAEEAGGRAGLGGRGALTSSLSRAE